MEHITRNTQEIIGIQHIEQLLETGVEPVVYWGTAPTGSIHIGYFVQMLKIADYVKAGCKVIILIADLHAFLDNMKTNLKLLEFRSQYYTRVITEMLAYLQVDMSKITFIKGTSFQLEPAYTMDMYKVTALTTLCDAKHAGAQVVKQVDNPKMNGLLYPILQALDEIYLNVNIVTGGVDQRKIMMFSKKFMPLIGYKRNRTHIMTPIVTGIRIKENVGEEKMSASIDSSKIDILDTAKNIRKKINKAYCLEGNIIDNSLLEITEKLIFPLITHLGIPFSTFSSYSDVVTAFETKQLHPGDFKRTIADILVSIIVPIQDKLNGEDFKNLVKNAYAC